MRAFFAPSSINSVPFMETELIIHFFLACNFVTLDKNHVQLFFFSIWDIEFETGKLSISIDQKNSIQMKGPVSDIKNIEIKI